MTINRKAAFFRLYPTPEQDAQMAQIAGACRFVSGIYSIRHDVPGGRIYVGSAVNIKSRWSKHVSDLARGKHFNKLLQEAWLLQGSGAFVFGVLEWVDDKSILAMREQYWIDELGAYGPAGFNLLPRARTPLGRRHTDETKAKIAAAHKGRKHSAEWVKNNSEAHKGIRPSPESASHGAEKRKGRKRSPEAIAKAAASNKGQKRTMEAKARMSAWQKGKPPSSKLLAALHVLAESWRGRKHSPETIEKMRAAALAREAAKRADSALKPVEGHRVVRPGEAGTSRSAA